MTSKCLWIYSSCLIMTTHTSLDIDNDASTSVNIINGTRSQLVAFLVLNMWPAHFGIPLLLAIILISKRIQRHPTFINLCLTFIIVGMWAILRTIEASALFDSLPPSSLRSSSLLWVTHKFTAECNRRWTLRSSVYTGKATGPEPSKTLCLFQASLLYGFPPM